LFRIKGYEGFADDLIVLLITDCLINCLVWHFDINDIEFVIAIQQCFTWYQCNHGTQHALCYGISTKYTMVDAKAVCSVSLKFGRFHFMPLLLVFLKTILV